MSKTKINDYINKQAVREVLGSFIKDPTLMKEYKTTQSDFVENFHKLIFSAIHNLHRNGVKEIDALAIDEYLSHYETQYVIFKKNQGVEFIEKIVDLSLVTNIRYYHDLLKKFTLLRRYVENGINVDDFFDPLEINPDIAEKKMEALNKSSIKEIIDHFKKKNMSVTAPFTMSEGRDSKKAGVGGREQKERWKKDTAWGLGYASAYLTTILHGIQKRRFNVMSAATGVGKTRISISNIAYACSPYYYDKELGEWCENPNGKDNRAVYIGTEMELLEEIDPILWAYIADVPQEHIQYNMYEEGEEDRVDEAIRILEEEAYIFLEYVPEYNSEILDTIIEEHKIKNNIGHVFFDYIHTTVELISEFATESKVKMVVREDQVLGNLSNKLKNLTRKYNVSIDACTQVAGDFKNDQNRDQTIVRGAKSIIDKADSAMIAMPPTEKELKRIEPILRRMMGKPAPNLVLSVYKNRGGKFNKVKVWLYVEYDTMRVHDLFVTDYNCEIDTNATKKLQKTYININEKGYAVTKGEKKPVKENKSNIEQKNEGFEF